MKKLLEPQAYRDFPARLLRWLLGWGLIILVSLGVMLLFLLIQATNNRELYERNYVRLFVLNVVVAVMLVSVIGWAVVQLLSRLRRGKFGSRLLLKLAAIFAVVGFVPGVLIYLVSYQFVSRSIESWFDVKVEGALSAGLNLGRASFDALGADLGNKTRAAANQLSGVSDAAAGLHLERLRDQLDASDVLLWSPSGTLLASAGKSRFQISPERPTPQQLRTVRTQRVMTQVLGLEELASADNSAARVSALALVPTPSIGLLAEPRYLQVTQSLPPTLVENALAVQEAHREYQERALGREGLRRMYIGTLTLCLFLAVLGAVLLAVVLGNQLARPLLLIAEGVRQVAAGDLSPKQVLQGQDEVRSLTRAFADMTQQLADARGAIELSLSQLHDARESLQTILDNLTAGVIVLSREGQMRSFNPSAARILRKPLSAYLDQDLTRVAGLENFMANVQAQFSAFEEEQHSHDHWQQSFTLHASHEQTQRLNLDDITLVARGALLPDATRLLVFDDISEVVSAQRSQAWGEVARRLAHEIKNPLTPIQLSAERLEMKLTGKLPQPEQTILTKSVQTIVDQVDAMKRLVNEFRDYARLPAADLKPLDLNALVQDLLLLYGAQPGEGGQIQAQLDPACPKVRGDAQQLRQVIHNLLQNAQDACDGAPQGLAEGGCIVVRTQWHEASGRVRLMVLDRGPGFAEQILKRAFEPYVTSKAKGTGLGLAVVKKIAEEHGARVDIANRMVEGVTIGAQVSLSFPVNGEARVG